MGEDSSEFIELEADEAEIVGEEEEEEEEAELTAQQEEIMRARRAAEKPKTMFVHTNLIDDYTPGASKERRLPPFLTRYELTKLLEVRAAELAKMSEAELEEDAGVPPDVFARLAENGRARLLTHLRSQLSRKVAAIGRLSFDDLSEYATVTPFSLCAPAQGANAAAAAERCGKPLLDQAIAKLRAAIASVKRDAPPAISVIEVAQEEWHWRRTTGYGTPYFLMRTRPDGQYEIWELHELDRIN